MAKEEYLNKIENVLQNYNRGEASAMRKLFWSFFLVVSLLLAVSHAQASELEMIFFNAGKADACLLKTENSTVLIDTGKNKFGKEIVSYLEENRINEIDVLFITHFDKDHVGGADKVLEEITVHQIYEPDYTSDSKQYVQYKEAVASSGAEVITLSQNAAFELDGVTYVIDVANQKYYGEDEENDFSLVISARHGEKAFLFAGDAENPRLSELLMEGVGNHDLLKVPHHGKAENLSASFFEAVMPAYSIITSDEEDLEEASVVNALKQYGKVYLTHYGSVKVFSDGTSLTVEQK